MQVDTLKCVFSTFFFFFLTFDGKRSKNTKKLTWKSKCSAQQLFPGQNIHHHLSYTFTIVNVFISQAHPRCYLRQGLKFEKKICNTRDIFIRCYKRYATIKLSLHKNSEFTKKNFVHANKQVQRGLISKKQYSRYTCVCNVTMCVIRNADRGQLDIK